MLLRVYFKPSVGFYKFKKGYTMPEALEKIQIIKQKHKVTLLVEIEVETYNTQENIIGAMAIKKLRDNPYTITQDNIVNVEKVF